MPNNSRTEKTLSRCARTSLHFSNKTGIWARCRHFTFILDGCKVVSMGINSRKTHPANLLHPYVNREMKPISAMIGTHSEMKAALLLGMENCRGLTLVNVRVDRKGRLAQSKPCKGCSHMISQLGFAEVWHTDEHGRFVRDRR